MSEIWLLEVGRTHGIPVVLLRRDLAGITPTLSLKSPSPFPSLLTKLQDLELTLSIYQCRWVTATLSRLTLTFDVFCSRHSGGSVPDLRN